MHTRLLSRGTRVFFSISLISGVIGCKQSAPQSNASTDAPTNCGEEYAPVCGKDNKTYSNACKAKVAGVDVANQGVCQKTEGDNRCTGVSSRNHEILITIYGMSPPNLGLRDKAYNPHELTIKRCDTVTWVNQDSRSAAAYHTAVADKEVDGKPYFDSGGIGKEGKSKPVQFPETGIFTYHCQPHPWMKGSITVTP